MKENRAKKDNRTKWDKAWEWFQDEWGYPLDLNLVLTFGGLTKRKIIKMWESK